MVLGCHIISFPEFHHFFVCLFIDPHLMESIPFVVRSFQDSFLKRSRKCSNNDLSCLVVSLTLSSSDPCTVSWSSETSETEDGTHRIHRCTTWIWMYNYPLVRYCRILSLVFLVRSPLTLLNSVPVSIDDSPLLPLPFCTSLRSISSFHHRPLGCLLNLHNSKIQIV